jgi:hypothetical protein
MMFSKAGLTTPRDGRIIQPGRIIRPIGTPDYPA